MRPFSLPLVLAALLAAPATAQPASPKPLPEAASPADVELAAEEHRVHFAWAVPEGWERRSNTNGMVSVAVSPREGTGDRFQENVNVTVKPVAPGVSLDEAWGVGLSQLQLLLPGIEVAERERVAVGTRSGYRAEMTYTFQGLDVRAMQLGVIHDDCAYTLTATALAADFDAYAPVFERVLESFRVGE